MMPRRLTRRTIVAAPLAVVPVLLAPGLPGLRTGAARAAEGGFRAFLAAVGREAVARGVDARIVDRALARAEYLPHVIELDRHQPEGRMSFAEYIDKVVTAKRQQESRRHLADNRALLDGVWRRFGVDPRFIVALWAIESNFGKTTGSYRVVSSLATLGYDGRRGPYFRQELIAALRILGHGDIGASQMLGSWAGAMGQCQFMPSTFLRYAVDYDGDGRRDIWTDRSDVLASIANFISHLGWRGGEGWGRRVSLPPGFDTRLAGLSVRRTTREWRRLGVRSADAQPLPQHPIEASLVLPDGPGGPAFLVFDNFRAIMKWNRSTYFAAAVGYLADSMGRA